MTDSEFEGFRVEISRELGGIAEQLRSINQYMADFKGDRTAMWKKIDAQGKRLNKVEIKMALLAAGISFVVSNMDKIVGLFQ